MFSFAIIVLVVAAILALAVPVIGSVANTLRHLPLTRSPPPARKNMPPRMTVRACMDEFAAGLLAYIGPLAARIPHSGQANEHGRIVLLHEKRPPRLATWLVQRRLRALGWRVDGIGVDTPCDRPTMDALAKRLFPAATSEVPILVAHASTGVLARQLAMRHASSQTISPLRIITIGTPHRGSNTRTDIDALAPGSAYLLTVQEADHSEDRNFDAIAIYSDADALIEPPENGYYPGAFNIEVHDVGHFTMLFSPRVFRLIAENLEASRPERTT